MADKIVVEQIVQEFRKRLVEKLGLPLQVILYGSYAREEATKESDVDVLVIVPVLDKRTDDIIGEIAWEVGFEAGVVLSVMPVSHSELPLLKASPFFQAIQREGILL